jgi:hypothetical protein
LIFCGCGKIEPAPVVQRIWAENVASWPGWVRARISFLDLINRSILMFLILKAIFYGPMNCCCDARAMQSLSTGTGAVGSIFNGSLIFAAVQSSHANAPRGMDRLLKIDFAFVDSGLEMSESVVRNVAS